ncbi:TNF receptor-associated factor 6-like [Phalaenopsis equestris]|uniref:TNF receptor-associated factor 6-like n=1 Tax=Phalaenopsis equestris TaxID=78828 RepID=UPI0009E2F4AB|nr:TNF receptor-associated factor 6-like [Phalaenopsis equestris]
MLLNVIREEESASAGRTPPERERRRPMRVSLMTLLAIGDKLQVDDSTGDDIAGGGVRSASAAAAAVEEEEEAALCSVCAVRRKGAAFIPCGHTFCRVCSRALSTGGRRCPVCNGGISDVLDIF